MVSNRRIVRVSALVIVGAMGTVVALRAWQFYGHGAIATVAASEPVRWWRCRSSTRPMLVAAKDPWSITYTWRHGMGPGDVFLVIRSDGSATLEAMAHSSPKVTRTARLSSESISRLALTVDETGLLCQTPQPREGYRIWDIGRYSIAVVGSTAAKTVFVDECNYLPDPRAFYAVLDELSKLKGLIGDEVDWGPEGAASVERACSEDERADLARP